MDKIIELICAEARRRPGVDLAVSLGEVVREVHLRVVDLVVALKVPEISIPPAYRLKRPGENDTGIES